MASMESRFGGTVTFTIPADSTNRAKHKSVFDTCRRELLELVWSSADSQQKTSDGATNGPKVAYQSWHVQANPEQRWLTLEVLAAESQQTALQLQRLSASYLDRLRQVSREHCDRARQDEEDLSSRIQMLVQDLSGIEERIATIGERMPTSDPVAQIISDWDRLAAQEQEYESLLSTLTQATLRREDLKNTPMPRTVYVLPEKREQAYKENVVLSEDLRQLEVQLVQVKSALVSLWRNASSRLETLLDTAAGLSTSSQTPGAVTDDPKQAAMLDRIAESAESYHQKTAGFAQEWSRGLLGLQAITPDPAGKDVLDLYDRIARSTGDFLHETSGMLTALRLRVRMLKEQPTTSQSDYAIVAEVTKRFSELSNAHRDFERAATELVSSDNYLLSAMMQTVRRLTYRTRSTRKAVDQELENEARLEEIQRKENELLTLDNRIVKTQEAMIQTVTAMIKRQRDIRLATNLLPACNEAKEELVAHTTRHEILSHQLHDLRQQYAALQADSNDSDPLNVTGISNSAPAVSERPANLGDMLTAALLAWCITFLALLAAARVVLVSFPQPSNESS